MTPTTHCFNLFLSELSLSCGTSSGGGKIQVSCIAEGGVVSNVTCIYDDGDIIESCKLNARFVIATCVHVMFD